MTKIKVVKNKVAPPFKTAVVNMIYGHGISHVDEVLNLAVENEIVNKAGAWFSYNGEKIGQGAAAAANYLKDHPDTENEIEGKVRAILFPAKQEEETEETKEAE